MPWKWCLLLAALSTFRTFGARHGYGDGHVRGKLQLRRDMPPDKNGSQELDKAEAIKAEAMQVLLEGTKERCSSGKAIPEDAQLLCKQTEPSSLLEVMYEKLQNRSQEVALWLCSAAESTIDKEWSTRYSERLSCDEAATSTLGAMMDLDRPNATVSARLLAVARLTLWSTKFALVVATPFIPLPFGFLARKLLDVMIGQLTGEAEEELGALERRMEDISRRAAQRVQIDEAFRIGSAHARAANDQIKDMAIIDHLWSSSMTAMSEKKSNGDTALLWSTIQKVTSFNRWAIIEHDLAMCIEVLIPQDSLEIVDRAIFTKLMKVHFEMYMLVLSHMVAAVDANQNVEEMKAELSKKAWRMASMTLPQLVLLSTAVEPGQDLKTVRAMFDSDLLSATGAHREVRGCDFLQDQADYEFEFLAACVWLPFLRTSEAWATPLPKPVLLTTRLKGTDRSDPNLFELWHALQQSMEAPEIQMGDALLSISCPPGKFLSSVEYEYKKPQTSWIGKQHFLKGFCTTNGVVEMAANSQFTTTGICTDVVNLFSDHTTAVVTGITFDRSADGPAKIKESTCQLAYTRSSDGPFHIPGSSSVEKQDIFCEEECDAKSLTARGDYAYILRPAPESMALKQGEVDVLKVKDDYMQWQKAIQGPHSCVNTRATACRITSITLARNYMVFGLSNGKISWTSMEFDEYFLATISLGELATSQKPISVLVARGGFLFAASSQAMLVYMVSMMPRPIRLEKKFQVLPETSLDGMADGVRGLTVVGGNMYIASRRHLHQISIETQQSSFAYRGSRLSASIAGIQDGFLYVSWTSDMAVLDSEKEKEELTKVPLQFRDGSDVVRVMSLGLRAYDTYPPVIVSPEHSFFAHSNGTLELNLQSGSGKGPAIKPCAACYVKGMAVWRGCVYEAYGQMEALARHTARPLHPETQLWLDERGIQNPLASS